MDVNDASFNISNEKKKIKVAKWGTPKKYFKKPEHKYIFFPSTILFEKFGRASLECKCSSLTFKPFLELRCELS
jgi:hypothetical protein